MKSALLRTACRYVVSLSIALLMLLWAYPWRTAYGAFTFGALDTSIAYLIVALSMPFVVLAVCRGLWAFAGIRRSNSSLTIGTAIVSTAAFIAIAWLFGPIGLDIPGTRVRGIFFSEWDFITFILQVVPPFALLSSAVFVWRKDHGTMSK